MAAPAPVAPRQGLTDSGTGMERNLPASPLRNSGQVQTGGPQDGPGSPKSSSQGLVRHGSNQAVMRGVPKSVSGAQAADLSSSPPAAGGSPTRARGASFSYPVLPNPPIVTKRSGGQSPKTAGAIPRVATEDISGESPSGSNGKPETPKSGNRTPTRNPSARGGLASSDETAAPAISVISASQRLVESHPAPEPQSPSAAAPSVSATSSTSSSASTAPTSFTAPVVPTLAAASTASLPPPPLSLSTPPAPPVGSTSPGGSTSNASNRTRTRTEEEIDKIVHAGLQSLKQTSAVMASPQKKKELDDMLDFLEDDTPTPLVTTPAPVVLPPARRPSMSDTTTATINPARSQSPLRRVETTGGATGQSAHSPLRRPSVSDTAVAAQATPASSAPAVHSGTNTPSAPGSPAVPRRLSISEPSAGAVRKPSSDATASATIPLKPVVPPRPHTPERNTPSPTPSARPEIPPKPVSLSSSSTPNLPYAIEATGSPPRAVEGLAQRVPPPRPKSGLINNLLNRSNSSTNSNSPASSSPVTQSPTHSPVNSSGNLAAALSVSPNNQNSKLLQRQASGSEPTAATKKTASASSLRHKVTGRTALSIEATSTSTSGSASAPSSPKMSHLSHSDRSVPPLHGQVDDDDEESSAADSTSSAQSASVSSAGTTGGTSTPTSPIKEPPAQSARSARLSTFFGRLARTASLSGRDEIFKGAPTVSRENSTDTPAEKPEKPQEQPQEFIDPAFPPTAKKSPGYDVEGNKVYTTPFDLSLHEQDLHNPYYKPYFSGRLHRNLLATHADGDSAVISIEKPEGSICRVLCRTKNGNERLIIPLLQTTKELSKTLKTLRPELKKFHFSSVVDEELEKELEHLEAQQLVHHYKIGLLYTKPGQSENELYGNLEHSAAFEEFASLIGEKIELQGFKNFRGGLDVQSKHSYFTNFRGYDIMYHLNTLLPHFPADPQHLERKRHVGNDVSVIIFVDSPPAPDGSVFFDPSILTSEMNHVFVIICPLPMQPTDTKRKYQVSFAMKDTIRPTQPFLPWPPVFERGTEFREFLLTKIINTERVALTSGVFKEKLTKTRRMELQLIATKYLTQKAQQKTKTAKK